MNDDKEQDDVAAIGHECLALDVLARQRAGRQYVPKPPTYAQMLAQIDRIVARCGRYASRLRGRESEAGV